MVTGAVVLPRVLRRQCPVVADRGGRLVSAARPGAVGGGDGRPATVVGGLADPGGAAVRVVFGGSR
ncbi:hypothetical protein ACFUJR_08080 [Streptomyces sp. NPDC057271]|uniref:hypothetical protein n=1 Tax=unclassified Streptomyces TaxID=2593676 RepID=UPI0036269E29